MIKHRIMHGKHAGHVMLREMNQQKVTRVVFNVKTSSTGL